MPYGVELDDVIALALQNERDDIHTALPGVVVSYDPETQLADVQPTVKRPVWDDEGNRLQGESYPVLPKVPVRWPQCGGFAFVLPMKAGDFVWIEFSEGGTGEFRTSGQESEPFDVSRHTITHPYCSPGAPPDCKPMTDPQVTGGADAFFGKLNSAHTITISSTAPHIALGTNPSDFVALASLVKQELTKIAAALAAATAPAGTTGGPITYPGAAYTTPGNVASSEVGCL